MPEWPPGEFRHHGFVLAVSSGIGRGVKIGGDDALAWRMRDAQKEKWTHDGEVQDEADDSEVPHAFGYRPQSPEISSAFAIKSRRKSRGACSLVIMKQAQLQRRHAKSTNPSV